ncbi:EAL domain-containing protein [Methylobacterium aquaticum]|nr:EAL domain-containing protein [Methylobacterium aquaticum]
MIGEDVPSASRLARAERPRDGPRHARTGHQGRQCLRSHERSPGRGRLPPDGRHQLGLAQRRLRNLGLIAEARRRKYGCKPLTLCSPASVTDGKRALASRLQADASLVADQVDCLEVRSLGVDLALDDFGTSYSSLSYLRSFPFERIKLDRSFVAGADEPRTASVVRAVVGLARALVNQLRIGSGHP